MSGLRGFAAGLMTAAWVKSSSTRVVNATLLYDMVRVAVIGGIGLSGGKGGVRNVLVGAALIRGVINTMKIVVIPQPYQDLIQSTILLGAIIVAGLINPPDAQAAQQGPI